MNNDGEFIELADAGFIPKFQRPKSHSVAVLTINMQIGISKAGNGAAENKGSERKIAPVQRSGSIPGGGIIATYKGNTIDDGRHRDQEMMEGEDDGRKR